MADSDASRERAEPRGIPPGPDKMLSLVCALWLLNAATGAAVAIREGLPGELIAGVFTPFLCVSIIDRRSRVDPATGLMG